MAIIKQRFNKADRSGTGLHNFIAHYIEDYKYELLKNLGFNLRKFKASGDELYMSSVEIDFNYPIKCSKEVIIEIEFLDFKDSSVRIQSKMRNSSGILAATAVSTIVHRTSEEHSNHLHFSDYFKIVEEETEVYAYQ